MKQLAGFRAIRSGTVAITGCACVTGSVAIACLRAIRSGSRIEVLGSPRRLVAGFARSDGASATRGTAAAGFLQTFGLREVVGSLCDIPLRRGVVGGRRARVATSRAGAAQRALFGSRIQS